MLYILAFFAGVFAGVGVMCLVQCSQPEEVHEDRLPSDWKPVPGTQNRTQVN